MCDLKFENKDRSGLQSRLIYWVRTGKILWRPSQRVPEYELSEYLEARRLAKLKEYNLPPQPHD